MRSALAAIAVLFVFPGAASAQVLPPIDLLSTTTLASTGPERVGETLRLTAAVTSLGVPVTGGTVDFLEAPNTVLCDDVPVVTGSASCDVVPATSGLHSYVAQYNGTAGTLGSVSMPLAKTIEKTPVTVTALPRSITYGEALPTDLTATVSGAAAGTPACAIPGAPVNAGAYDDAIVCTAGTLDLTHFAGTFVPGDLTIAKAPLTLTAADATMKAGGALTGLSGTLSGFVKGETLATSGVSGATRCAGPDPLPATPGVYPGAINCVAGSFSAVNYVVEDLVPGTLTVLASTLPIPVVGGPDGATGPTTTTNTTNNVTNVGIVGGQAPAAPKAATLSLLTKKVKRAKKARLKLRSTGALSGLKLALKRNGKTVAKGTLAALDGDGSVTVKASKKLKKGLYTLQATWAGGKKRFNVRVK